MSAPPSSTSPSSKISESCSSSARTVGCCLSTSATVCVAQRMLGGGREGVRRLRHRIGASFGREHPTSVPPGCAREGWICRRAGGTQRGGRWHRWSCHTWRARRGASPARRAAPTPRHPSLRYGRAMSMASGVGAGSRVRVRVRGAGIHVAGQGLDTCMHGVDRATQGRRRASRPSEAGSRAQVGGRREPGRG